ncbi:RidA family protein [Halomonas beimenensis]|uniref:RidA/YER057c/UK114 superfamily protein n=1 Tax=Halomonas beimenensis TaxID=475662 RepID=A0A291P632_9GAMM|nr:RidA family protein [Halomonas beimenensis]ATJ82363.1 RidA/YER057c/UK114 superfamily protein [Halomonas beimenensis]
MPEFHNSATLPHPQFPGSHIVMDEDYIHLSGLTAADIQGSEAVLGDIGEETRWIMRRLAHLLESAGCGLEDVVRVMVHMTDLDEAEAMDAAYVEFFTPPNFPARTCTESPRLLGGAHVEITLTARRPTKDKAPREPDAEEDENMDGDAADRGRDPADD